MTPFKKLVPHDPANGTYGDCYRTAIACLLDVHPALVPHVMDPAGGGHPAMRAWLQTRGLTTVSIPLKASTPKAAMQKMAEDNPDALYLLFGLSKKDIGHCVVCRGASMLHDPSTEDVGLAKPLWQGEFLVHLLVPSFMQEGFEMHDVGSEKMVAE